MTSPDKYVSLWSARFHARRAYDWIPSLEEIVHNHPKVKYFGFTSDENRSYTFTRYPREKYGVQTDEALERALVLLQMALFRSALSYHNILEHLGSAKHDYRVVLGRYAGYTKQEVVKVPYLQRMLPHSQVKDAKIASVYEDNGIVWTYTEPAALIFTHENELERIARIAAELEQERYTVEDFRRNRAWTVEVPSTR